MQLRSLIFVVGLIASIAAGNGCAETTSHPSPPTAQATTTGADVSARLARRGGEAAKFGQVKPITGKDWRRYLAEQRGKVVVVNFWATWCDTCREEIPGFVALQNKYGSQGLQIIGLSIDEGPIGDVQKFYNEYKMNYPVFIADLEITEDPLWGGVEITPTTVILDKTGKRVKRFEDEELTDQETFEKTIEPLLK